MKKKSLLLSLLAAFFLLSFAIVGGAWLLLDYSLKPGDRGRDTELAWNEMGARYPGLLAWRDSLLSAGALRDTAILAPDGARLHAYYVRAARPTRRTAVLVHGYTDNAVRMMMLGRMYGRDLGYNILLPDLRNAGGTDGDHYQMGWLDRLDVRRWLDVVPAVFGDSAAVVVHGVSMGAATTMMLSGEPDLPPCVKAFVEDCGYTTVWAQFEKELGERFHLPAWPLMPVANALCRLRCGWDFREASALDAVRRCPLPMLFIHGSADAFVPTRMVRELYAAKPAPKSLWIAPSSAHALSFRDHTDEYTRRVAAFLALCIPASAE